MRKRFSLPFTFLVFLLCLLIYLVLIIIIQPVGEFLVTDEWMFVKVVKCMLDTGRIRFIDIMPMSFLAQAYMGLVFCKIFGFSFSSLKVLSILVSLCGAVSFYLILRKSGCGRRYSLIGMLFLIFNPIYLLHGLCFRTDVFFITFMLLGIYCIVEMNEKDSLFWCFLAGLFFSICVLIRQFGLLVLLPVFTLILIKRRCRLFLGSGVLWFILLIPIFVLLVFYWWYFYIHGPTPLYKWHQEMIKDAFLHLIDLHRIKKVWEGGWANLFYIGLYIHPIALAYLVKRRFNLNLYILLGGLLFAFSFYIVKNRLNFGYDIYNFGLGMPALFILGAGSHFSVQCRWFWVICVCVSLIGGLFFLSSLWYLFKIGVWKIKVFPLALILNEFIVLFGFVSFVWLCSQRYIIMAIPFAIAIVVGYAESLRVNTLLIGMLSIPLFVFSVLGTQDYIGWHRAEWEGIRFLKDKGIPLREISGGAEFADWYFYESPRLKDYPYSPYRESYFADGKVGDRYAISMAPINGYKVIKKIRYRTFLRHFGEEKWIYVLKKDCRI